MIEETTILEKPWQKINSIGVYKNLKIKNTEHFIVIRLGYQIKYIKENDCVEIESIYIRPNDKIFIMILSDKSWNPTWRKVAERRSIIGCNMIIGQQLSYYNVLLFYNNQQKRCWISENDLMNFIWSDQEILSLE